MMCRWAAVDVVVDLWLPLDLRAKKLIGGRICSSVSARWVGYSGRLAGPWGENKWGL